MIIINSNKIAESFATCRRLNYTNADLKTYYSGLSLSRTRKGPTNLFEIEKITVNIEIFTNKTREANKELLDASDIKFKCSENFC